MIRIYEFDKLSPEEILNRDIQAEEDVSAAVDAVLAEVRAKGDSALFAYTERFDGVALTDLQVSEEEMAEALERVEPEFLEVLRHAAKNIRKFHEKQVRNSFLINDEDGVVMGQKVIPVDRAGLYVPGGTAA